MSRLIEPQTHNEELLLARIERLERTVQLMQAFACRDLLEAGMRDSVALWLSEHLTAIQIDTVAGAGN